MISARREFLEAFLGALGAAEIVAWCEREAEISGTLRWAEDSEVLDLSGDEGGELQDFAWRVTEAEAPSLLAFRLADLLRRYQLLEVGWLRVSPEALRAILQQDLGAAVDAGEFRAALAELRAVEVPMFDGSVATGDVFCLR